MVMQYIDPANIEPHYSTAFCRSHKSYLQNLYSPTLFTEICEELKVPEDYLLKHENWVSNAFMSKYIDKVIEKTGDKNIFYKIGKNFWDPNAISPLEYTLQRLIPPFLFYILYPIQGSKLNLYSRYRSTFIRPGHFIYEVTHKGPLHPEICNNMIGVLEGTKEIFGLSFIKVRHDKCVNHGAELCEFELTYSALSFWKQKFLKFGLAILLLSIVYPALNYFITPTLITKNLFVDMTLFTLLSLIGVVLLGTQIFSIVKFNKTYYEQNKRKNDELFEKNKKLDRRYQESNLLRDLSLKFVRFSSSKDLITSSLNELEKRFGYERAIVMQMDALSSRLNTVDVRGFKENTDTLFKLSFKYPAEKESPQIFANILERGECTLIDNIEEFKKTLEPQNQLLLMAFGVKSLIVSPIQDATNKYGVLVIGSIGEDRQLKMEDKHLIENITRMLALFFQNARNFEKERTLKTLFQKYVPQVVIDGIRHLEAGDSGYLIPKNNAVSSIFVDLRDFTATSETLAPERVVEMLNLYIDYVSKFIASEGGIIDNLVGDGIVAFFPAADADRTEHARKALKSAIRILANLDKLNELMTAKGFPKVRIGIGLHSGNATVGNIGSDRKMNYTAIGDTINLASRLETLCKKYDSTTPSAEQGLLIFSNGVLGRARLVLPCTEIGTIKVRGRHDGVNVYMIDKETAMGIDLDNLKVIPEDELQAKSSTPLLTVGDTGGRRRTDKRPKRRAS